MKTPISYYGGKQNLVKTILPLIPRHRIYCEPFFGGGAVYFAKRPAKLSAINDTSNWAITFYRQLQDHFGELNAMIQGTLHSEAEFNRAKDILKSDQPQSDLDIAWAFWVQTNMSFGKIMFAGFASSNNPHPISRGSSEPQQTNNRKKRFHQYKQALESTEIFNRDALNVIELKDTKETFHYIDPPYFNSNCGHYGGYTEEDFKQLLYLLQGIEGKFLLSCYPSDTLEAWRDKNDFQSMDIVKNLKVSSKDNEGKKKTECLTWNYSLDSDNQATLF